MDIYVDTYVGPWQRCKLQLELVSFSWDFGTGSTGSCDRWCVLTLVMHLTLAMVRHADV